MRSMASGAAFHRAYLHATQQAFLEARQHAFAYFGHVFHLLRYDNLASAVRKILRGYRREETVRFLALRSHWRFAAEFWLRCCATVAAVPAVDDLDRAVRHLFKFDFNIWWSLRSPPWTASKNKAAVTRGIQTSAGSTCCCGFSLDGCVSPTPVRWWVCLVRRCSACSVGSSRKALQACCRGGAANRAIIGFRPRFDTQM